MHKMNILRSTEAHPGKGLRIKFRSCVGKRMIILRQ